MGSARCMDNDGSLSYQSLHHKCGGGHVKIGTERPLIARSTSSHLSPLHPDTNEPVALRSNPIIPSHEGHHQGVERRRHLALGYAR